jgi:hypothetical protein
MQGQNCLQPEFAKSDEQFRRDQTLHSLVHVLNVQDGEKFVADQAGMRRSALGS